ncbi:hypothetical protein BGZ95_009032 [Linnemannia exigua]|uniref:Triacylglycerol lipase n=1 Tax=Linnemannia exigua TaxID=604196 RepID=A0AAD4DDK2_9FUNG|nr:hypothetical protein BGZ95_009032 [Linnemannia exigua]
MDTIQDLNYGVALPESDQTDWSCVPSDEHPYPVILLHGLFAPAFKSWRIMARRLSDIGYCVYQLKYGMFPDFETLGGISDIRESAKELDTFITKVLATTHAQKVDLIGHSEGPVVARWYLKYLDRQGQEQEQQEQKQDGEVNIQDEQQQQQQHVRKEREGRVRSLVSIAPVGKGTSVNGILAMIKVLGIYESLAGIVQPYCAACVQILEGSDLLQQLYGQDGLQAEVEGVRYLNIVTSRDNVVTPFTNGVMTIPDESSKEVVKERQDTANKVQVNSSHPRPRSSSLLQNLVIENHCAYNSVHSDHCGIFQSPFAFHATNAFLSSDGLSSTLDTNNVIPCTLDPESDAS